VSSTLTDTWIVDSAIYLICYNLFIKNKTKNTITKNATNNTNGIQRGAVTHHHDHVIVSVSFNIKNTMNNTVSVGNDIVIFLLDIFLKGMIYLFTPRLTILPSISLSQVTTPLPNG
jgi:hypothetical protein